MPIEKRKIQVEIERILNLALNSHENVALADRYVEIARKLSMKSRIRIPKVYKFFICRGCKRILLPGKTARFRIKKRGRISMIVVTCLRCKHVYRRIVEKRKV